MHKSKLFIYRNFSLPNLYIWLVKNIFTNFVSVIKVNTQWNSGINMF